MNIYDIAIGFIIGMGVERATSLSKHIQKGIDKVKANHQKEIERKKKLLEEADKHESYLD